MRGGIQRMETVRQTYYVNISGVESKNGNRKAHHTKEKHEGWNPKNGNRKVQHTM
jgi:hypothetical protein